MGVLLDICSACGSRCRYCIHQSKRLCKRENMSHESFDSITGILLKEGFRDVYLYFTGEPLLNPLYPVFLSSCGIRGFSNINTATKLNAKVDWDAMDRALGFCDNSCVSFLVGVDSLEDESLKAISPGASAETLKVNLEMLSKTIAKHRQVKVLVNTVVTRPNEKYLADIER
jgi:molybdenum cofactor biosynthesis enzyme MoaA